MSGSMKKAPLSLESLLTQQKAEKDAQSRPVFMTKSQREALAAQQKEEEAKGRLSKQDEARRQREQLERKVWEERQASNLGGFQRAGANQDHRMQDRRIGHSRGQQLDYGGVPTGPKALRGGGGAAASGRDDRREPPPSQQRQAQAGPSSYSRSDAVASASARNGAPSDAADDALPVYDPLALKARYLGDKTAVKRKTRKQSDKKFVFDWDKTEDTATANEVDPLYITLRAGGGHQLTPANARPNGGANGTLVSTAKAEDETDVPLAGPTIRAKAKVRSIIDERHWTEKGLDEMKERDWRIFREDFSIAARGGSIPLPMRYWHESSIPANIQQIISEVGYAEPSAIQRQAIPIGLNVRDMIGIAETGSGKTAAFVIPMLTYISRLPPLTDANRHMGPYALILAPTRELAQQIEVETRKFTSKLGYKCVSIVGGRSMDEQALNLRDGAEIIIATPGRLKDCIEKSVVVFSQCTYVVMDEADRMISLGFEDVINFILDTLPVSNLKPDTEEAEDATKMLAQLIGGDDGRPLADVYAYRQTVCLLSVVSLPS